MGEKCWICGFEIDQREYEDVVYTRTGICHGYCLELYPLEVSDDIESRIPISE